MKIKKILEKQTNSSEETKLLGHFLYKQIIPKVNHKIIILIEGLVGAGKTILVKGLAESLGIYENIKSPTFLLMKTYLGEKKNLHHLDTYRLDFNDEILEELSEEMEKGDILILESPSNLNIFFHLRIKIEYLTETKRKIIIEKNII